jgi:hypothetical protein
VREHLRFVASIALTLVVGACQPAAGGPDTASDQAKLRAGAALDAGTGNATGDAPGAAPQKCGATTCDKGSVCCNASCGICTQPGGVCIQLACDPGSAGKTCATTRCDAGETCMDTRGGPQCVAKADDPCDLLDCPPNAICKVVQGAATCVPVPTDPGAGKDAGVGGPVVTPGSCALVLCAGICRDVPGGFICEPKAPVQGASCAATTCPVGHDCDDSSGTAKCVQAPSCAAVLCAAGTRCELKPVQCIRAPCPAQPTCVPSAEADVCATVRCKAGTHCEAKEVQCIRAPCPPIAECVPDGAGTPCGKNTCTGDTFCCNASCGTCAPRGGACTQQFCDGT